MRNFHVVSAVGIFRHLGDFPVNGGIDAAFVRKGKHARGRDGDFRVGKLADDARQGKIGIHPRILFFRFCGH